MINKKKNIFENINFKSFASQICEVLKDAFEKFWEQDVKITLQAVNDFRELREEILTKNIDFFSSQIKVENHKPVVIRLSKEFVENFLEISLGERNHGFRLTKLSPLEIKILNTFGEFIYKKLKDILIPVKDAKLSDKSEKNINLIFMFTTKNEICSKVMISIPADRINFAPIKKTISFKDEDFLTSSTVVGLRIGSSKLTLDELQNLSKDDIVVLEESDLSKATLLSGDVEKKFNIKIKSSLIVDLDDEEDEEEIENMQKYNEVKMEKNLWDDIQIEVSAEFEKVKMTIGELKQITQGQIVDLGSVFENEISLFVEDKKVAKGELIIINDRYAVRLNEIISSSAQSSPIKANVQQEIPAPNKVAQQAAQTSAKPMPKAPQQAKPPIKPATKPQPKPSNDEEEFDYSDFEK